MSTKKPQDPEVNLDQIISKLNEGLKRFGLGGGSGLFFLVIVLVLVAMAGWLASGFFTVAPAEVSALKMFGKYVDQRGPGLHWYWPAPVGSHTNVDVQQRRRLEIGVRGNQPFAAESLMITGDENIVDVQLLVQWDVKNIEDYLFRVLDPGGETIKDAAETALRQVVGSRNIDDVLTVEKEAVQADTELKLQQLLDTYRAGIQVREVKLLNVNPPQEVRDAFDDVVRAREDKERIINLADAYSEDILPRARGDAQRLLQEAEAFKAERINVATGEAQRFTAILQEYRKAPEVTRQRMYLEAMERLLPGVTKLILDPNVNTIIVPAGSGGTTVVPAPTPAPANP